MKLYQITYDDGSGYDDIQTWLFASDDDLDCSDDDDVRKCAVALGIAREDEEDGGWEECGEWRATLSMETIESVSVVKNGKMLKKDKRIKLK